MLAVVLKLIILDLSSTDAFHLLAIAAAILALGAVYWLVRDQGQPREIIGGRRMRLHCKAVATKADKTSSNSKFLA